MKISLRYLCFLLLGLLAVTLIAACSSTVNHTRVTSQKPQDDGCRVVQHTMGETCIPQNPQRVVALSQETFINGLELGVPSIATVFVPGFPFPEYLQGKVSRVETVGTYDSPNLEKILYLQPDLILADSYYSQNIYNQLSQIAPTIVLNVPFPPPSWKDQLEELARILDKEDVGQQLINNYWQRIEQLQQALGLGAASPKENRRHTLKVSIANTSSESGIWSYGEKHHSGETLKDIGLQRPESQKGDFFYIENISIERISDIDGDVLFFVSWEREDDKKTLGKLKQSPLWAKLNVVQRDQVHFVGMHWHNSDILAINAILDDLFKYLVNTP
ncbi:MAG: iron-siderophore ABC transporter substrate-binding protein [Elainella sp. C42_A2020_010]|nr:iron-siderophore ABC transporter substrate-binding protein [Elainella sp. C42_A2020_010]